MGCNTSKEAMQAVENNAENSKEKLKNASKDNVLNNVSDKAKGDAGDTEVIKLEDDLVDIDLEDPEVAEAATKIQAAFRGHKTRKTMKQEDTEPEQNFEEEFSPDDKELCEAATKIQASFRGHLARKTGKKDDEEEEELSKKLEKLDAKAPEEEEELDIDLSDPDLQVAATKIQASFRGHRVRKETKGAGDQ